MGLSSRSFAPFDACIRCLLLPLLDSWIRSLSLSLLFQAQEVISNSAAKTLRHFCRWQHLRSLEKKDAGSNVSYDASLLLTREDLCRQPQSCDTLGLAQLGQ